MVQPLKRYPDESINVNAGPIRNFKESYVTMRTDIIDTMKAHDLSELSAIQIGYDYQLMVLKEGDDYITYANPRIITQSDPFDSTETSSYFFGQPITVKRYAKLSIVYEDAKGEMQTQKIDDPSLAARFQRKLDYLFNTTLLDRLLPHQREQAIKALAGKGHMPDLSDAFCPTESKKEYFVSVADKLLFFMFVSLLLPLFNLSKETLSSWYTYDKIAFPTVILLMIGFFFYAQYEAKKYKQCSSCQIGNNIGVMVKRGVAAIAFAIGAYFLVNPN
jgi:peptide deformylase